MSTSGVIPSVHQEGYHEYIGRCSVHRREYIGRCSVHRRDTMSTSEGYHEYIGGIS